MYPHVRSLSHTHTHTHTHTSLQSHQSLELLAKISNKSITEIMEPHREILADMIPPKKHLLKHQPVSTQIALMDGNTFCMSLAPTLFAIDMSIGEHEVFFTEVCVQYTKLISRFLKKNIFRIAPRGVVSTPSSVYKHNFSVNGTHILQCMLG